MKKYVKEIIIGIVAGFLNGMFGSGGGTVVVPAMEKFLGMEEKKAHATAIGVILIMSLVSSGMYIAKGFFNFSVWGLVSIGGLLGGFVGARLLGKISPRILKLLFGGVIIVTAVKMIF